MGGAATEPNWTNFFEFFFYFFKPNQMDWTKPNQTEPNQIKPNQIFLKKILFIFLNFFKPNQMEPNQTHPNQIFAWNLRGQEPHLRLGLVLNQTKPNPNRAQP